MNSPKIKSIKVNSENYSISVLFDNGVTKNIDFKDKIKEDFYCDLKNKLLFEKAKVDAGGYGISWNDGIDISEYELWNM